MRSPALQMVCRINFAVSIDTATVLTSAAEAAEETAIAQTVAYIDDQNITPFSVATYNMTVIDSVTATDVNATDVITTDVNATNVNTINVNATDVNAKRLYLESTPPGFFNHFEIDTENDIQPGSFISDEGSLQDPGITMLEIIHKDPRDTLVDGGVIVGSSQNWIYTFVNHSNQASKAQTSNSYYQWLFIFTNVEQHTWADVDFKEIASNADYASDNINTWCTSGFATTQVILTGTGVNVNVESTDFYVIVRRNGTFKGDTYAIKVNLYD